MSASGNVIQMCGAPTVVEHLLAAHDVVRDPLSKALIEAALMHEGRKIAASVPIEAFREGRHPGGR